MTLEKPEYDSLGIPTNMSAHKIVSIKGMLRSLSRNVPYDVAYTCPHCGCEFAILLLGDVQPECSCHCPRCQAKLGCGD